MQKTMVMCTRLSFQASAGQCAMLALGLTAVVLCYRVHVFINFANCVLQSFKFFIHYAAIPHNSQFWISPCHIYFYCCRFHNY